uniref:Uncharacterized protein n=1 Tax=Emiliania huxleyi (strain CCMP1516) TaxID=280463 RepID=A0A0D3K1P3_EMIH1
MTVPPRRCGGARKADPTRQPPGACIQASATAGSAPARHDSGPRGVADGAESAPEARPAVGWSPRAPSGCRHGHLRSSCARCASRRPGAAARALCRCLLSLDGSARTTDVLPPLRPRSGPLVDTRNQQTPVSELLCRLGASIADGGVALSRRPTHRVPHGCAASAPPRPVANIALNSRLRLTLSDHVRGQCRVSHSLAPTPGSFSSTCTSGVRVCGGGRAA